MARTRHPKHQNIFVRKLPSGSTRYDVPYREPDGKQRTKTFTKIADATAFMHSVEADKRRGVYRDLDAGRITFKEYGEQWLSSRTFNRSSYDATELRLRLHVYPVLGSKSLRDIRPSMVQAWLHGLGGAETTRRVIFANVSSVFAAAVDDDLIAKNPCRASSVMSPRPQSRKITPWEVTRVFAVRDAMSERYRIAATLASGLGLRQGEVFALSPADVDFLRGIVTVQRQVKVFGGNKLVFALPKGRKTRSVPLPSSVREALAAYLVTYPATTVELPWETPDSDKLVRVSLVLSTRERSALNRNYINTYIWKKALMKAGVEPSRENGMHALRHFYASVLLDAGESIRAVSEYLGHSDPGFTLRVYTHLMPSSAERTRSAVDAAFSPDVVSVLYGDSAKG